MKLSKLFLTVLFISLSVSFISALGVDIPIPTNYSLVNTNHSATSDYATTSGSADFWDGLDTPADILHSDLDNLAWSVAGHIIDSNLTPYSTLTYWLGLPTKRWLWGYFSNISADNINASTGYFSNNLTIDGYINGVNISNLSNQYVPYNNANQNVDLGTQNLSADYFFGNGSQLKYININGTHISVLSVNATLGIFSGIVIVNSNKTALDYLIIKGYSYNPGFPDEELRGGGIDLWADGDGSAGYIYGNGNGNIVFNNVKQPNTISDGTAYIHPADGSAMFASTKIHLSSDGSVSFATLNFQVAATGETWVDADNVGLKLGEGGDSKIYYNSSDLIINPKVLGSGGTYVLGDLDVKGNITGNYQTNWKSFQGGYRACSNATSSYGEASYMYGCLLGSGSDNYNIINYIVPDDAIANGTIKILVDGFSTVSAGAGAEVIRFNIRVGGITKNNGGDYILSATYYDVNLTDYEQTADKLIHLNPVNLTNMNPKDVFSSLVYRYGSQAQDTFAGDWMTPYVWRIEYQSTTP